MSHLPTDEAAQARSIDVHVFRDDCRLKLPGLVTKSVIGYTGDEYAKLRLQTYRDRASESET